MTITRTSCPDLTDDEFAYALGCELNLPVFSLETFVPDPSVVRLISLDTLRRHLCLPFSIADSILTLVMADPTNDRIVEEIELLTALKIQRAVGIPAQIEAILNRCFFN